MLPDIHIIIDVCFRKWIIFFETFLTMTNWIRKYNEQRASPFDIKKKIETYKYFPNGKSCKFHTIFKVNYSFFLFNPPSWTLCQDSIKKISFRFRKKFNGNTRSFPVIVIIFRWCAHMNDKSDLPKNLLPKSIE